MFGPGLTLQFAYTLSEQEIRDYLATFPGVEVESYYEPLKIVGIKVPDGTEPKLQDAFDKTKVKRAERRVYLQPK